MYADGSHGFAGLGSKRSPTCTDKRRGNAMTTEHTPGGLIGKSVRRVEDPVLITGKGCYVDDIQLPGMLHMVFLRSPYPHAKILSIHTSAAQAMPGVVAVVTGDDLSEHLHVPVMPLVPAMEVAPTP